MKTSVKTALIIATVTLILGIVLACVGISMAGLNFINLVTETYTPITYGVSDDFANIIVETDTHDLSFVLSEKNECRVVCDETNKLTHTVSVQDGTLVIKTVNSKNWYDYIGIFTQNHTITVYLPKEEYNAITLYTDTGDMNIGKDFSFNTAKVETDTGDTSWYANVSESFSFVGHTCDIEAGNMSLLSLNIKTTTGKIRVSNLTATEGITLTADTGDVSVTDCKANEMLDVKTSTGDVSLKNTTAGKLDIKTSTGSVTFNNADAENISVKTDTGDVRGTLMTEKIFFPTTDTGKISLPRTTSGGICEITTSTGNIKIDIAEN